ncbi:hypothetical protein ACWDRR_25220 [Kitasatospora sp. NPDC003701]
MSAYTRCSALRCFDQATEYLFDVPLCAAHAAKFGRVPEAPSTVCASLGCPHGAEFHPAGVALCDRHRAELAAEMVIQHVKNTTRAARKQASARGVIGRPRALTNLVYDPAAEHLHSNGVVYYVTWRNRLDRIKIGTSTDCRQRFQSGELRPFGEKPQLLVAEPGGSYEENQRHLQFHHLRRGGEFFEYTDELVEHVHELRQRSPDYRDLAEVGYTYG